ncbi:MAG: phosphate acyltransferase PlsX [Vampirovibrionales bacterium]|nr:phosphate acyltransferase PlsX [Vampirovibrionales bacterium]
MSDVETAPSQITISVDGMGGDYAPGEVVQGVLDALKTFDLHVLLVGQPEVLKAELTRRDVAWQQRQLTIVPAQNVIDMGESPLTAIRKKKDASIVVVADMVGQKKAQAMVAAGSTGAAMASALFRIGRLPGVDRPAIGVALCTPQRPTLLLDAGANADCTPDMLHQFAQMGSVFMQALYPPENHQKPRIALLNIGEEPGKGNVLANEAFDRLRQDSSLNFIGNGEGRDLFSGKADVLVCDGFSGNIALKAAEGLGKVLGHFIKEELSSTLQGKIGGLLAKSALTRAKNRFDPEEFGGALLLGIDGICVISHGSSHARGIFNAIRVAKEAVEGQVIARMTKALVQDEASGDA